MPLGRADVEAVLQFWFEEVGPARWYAGDAEIDAAVRARFADMVHAARGEQGKNWILDPSSALALMIVLDQFPRHIWRGDARAYEGDHATAARAKRAINLKHDLKTPEPQRQFFYTPLMHAENQADQDRCVRLIITRMPQTGADNLAHALAHREIIRRFGRFPYRNSALRRRDTPEEAAWLAAGGYRA